MPYELVFGQPPRSIFIPDAFFKGQINEEDIQPDNETETVEEDEDIETAVPNVIEVEEREDIRVEEYKGDESVEEDKMKEISSEVEEDTKINDEEDINSEAEEDHEIDESKIVKTVGDVQTKVSERVLATTKKHSAIRQQADRAYLNNIQRMKGRFAKKTKEKINIFEVGDYVSVRIPHEDRTSTDVNRLPCVVVQVIGKSQSLYRLRCRKGTIKTCFRASELEYFEGCFSLSVTGWKKEQMISLREAARNIWNVFNENRCQCTTKCDSKRCKCRRSRISCSSHCHGGKSCCNKNYEEKHEKENEVNFFLIYVATCKP